jgi:hypothetical protein
MLASSPSYSRSRKGDIMTIGLGARLPWRRPVDDRCANSLTSAIGIAASVVIRPEHCVSSLDSPELP